MRTTLDIEDSVLEAVKELARRQGKTAGEVISGLTRQALLQGPGSAITGVKESVAIYGFRPLPAGEIPVSNELIDRLRDEHGV